MIDDKHIEWYFNWMKLKDVIAEGWEYTGYVITIDSDNKEYIKIIYNHKSGKRSSYKFLMERVMEELREAKLKQLFD